MVTRSHTIDLRLAMLHQLSDEITQFQQTIQAMCKVTYKDGHYRPQKLPFLLAFDKNVQMQPACYSPWF